MLHLEAKPNSVHQFIAECEKKEKSLGVVTQNIDGLHQAAGSKKVYEIHGSVLRNYCEKCNHYYPVEYVQRVKVFLDVVVEVSLNQMLFYMKKD